MTYPSSSEDPAPVVPPVRTGHRRQFSEAQKQHILMEANKPGASVSEVARRFGIARRVLCRWRKEAAAQGPAFVAVEICDHPQSDEEVSS